jgi:hypothetical protein
MKPLKFVAGTKGKDLAFANIVPQGTTTVQQLIWLLQTYTHAPVTATDTLGPLVPSTDILGADVNQTWNLPKGYGYRSGDIPATWTVQQLANDIDQRVTAAKAAGLPAGV